MLRIEEMRIFVVGLTNVVGIKDGGWKVGTRMEVRTPVSVSIRSICVKGTPDLPKDSPEPFIAVAVPLKSGDGHHIITAHGQRSKVHLWRGPGNWKVDVIVRDVSYKAYSIRRMVVCIPLSAWNSGRLVIWTLDHSSVQRNQNEKSKIYFWNSQTPPTAE